RRAAASGAASAPGGPRVAVERAAVRAVVGPGRARARRHTAKARAQPCGFGRKSSVAPPAMEIHSFDSNTRPALHSLGGRERGPAYLPRELAGHVAGNIADLRRCERAAECGHVAAALADGLHHDGRVPDRLQRRTAAVAAFALLAVAEHARGVEDR